MLKRAFPKSKQRGDWAEVIQARRQVQLLYWWRWPRRNPPPAEVTPLNMGRQAVTGGVSVIGSAIAMAERIMMKIDGRVADCQGEQSKSMSTVGFFSAMFLSRNNRTHNLPVPST